MDPEVCLYNCDQAISDLRIKDAVEKLAEYRAWRRNGGFQPHCLFVDKMGDKFANECERRIQDIARSPI